jgi:hypothetical protein
MGQLWDEPVASVVAGHDLERSPSEQRLPGWDVVLLAVGDETIVVQGIEHPIDVDDVLANAQRAEPYSYNPAPDSWPAAGCCRAAACVRTT